MIIRHDIYALVRRIDGIREEYRMVTPSAAISDVSAGLNPVEVLEYCPENTMRFFTLTLYPSIVSRKFDTGFHVNPRLALVEVSWVRLGIPASLARSEVLGTIFV